MMYVCMYACTRAVYAIHRGHVKHTHTYSLGIYLIPNSLTYMYLFFFSFFFFFFFYSRKRGGGSGEEVTKCGKLTPCSAVVVMVMMMMMGYSSVEVGKKYTYNIAV